MRLLTARFYLLIRRAIKQVKNKSHWRLERPFYCADAADMVHSFTAAPAPRHHHRQLGLGAHKEGTFRGERAGSRSPHIVTLPVLLFCSLRTLTVRNRQITCPLSAEPLLGNTRTQRWQGTPYIRSCPQSQSVVDPPPSICISSPACRAPPCASGLATEKNASCLPPTSSTWVTPSLLPVQTPQVREPPLAADSRCRRRRAPHQFIGTSSYKRGA